MVEGGMQILRICTTSNTKLKGAACTEEDHIHLLKVRREWLAAAGPWYESSCAIAIAAREGHGLKFLHKRSANKLHWGNVKSACHGVTGMTGTAMQLCNFLSIFKIFALIFAIVIGFVTLSGHIKVPKPDNFSSAFEGTTANMLLFCLGLYNVIWLYIGFSSANYVLVKMKSPVCTVHTTRPPVIGAAAILYMPA
ncbi:hypothetical protein BDQ12DRAFT_666500 [Crucibulum laeve]|uniref:Uncharacterized protein n=1 Tax=Crucibulum laeve TaxID=68775 RepID=A0A5C3LYX2_9AGAR|nr:hypothetical protein BDQ12DRAFT_666500 [Crucibulum laeve]